MTTLKLPKLLKKRLIFWLWSVKFILSRLIELKLRKKKSKGKLKIELSRYCSFKLLSARFSSTKAKRK